MNIHDLIAGNIKERPEKPKNSVRTIGFYMPGRGPVEYSSKDEQEPAEEKCPNMKKPGRTVLPSEQYPSNFHG